MELMGASLIPAFTLICAITVQKILSEGVPFWHLFFFLVDEGWENPILKYHYKRAIISPPAKRHLNGVSLACWWWPNIECWLGSLVIFRGIWTRIAKNLYTFVIFREDSDTLSPLRIRAWLHVNTAFYQGHISIYKPWITSAPNTDHAARIPVFMFSDQIIPYKKGCCF